MKEPAIVKANGKEVNDFDFVSFPTLPDPEDDPSGQTLTKLLTKTLKRVTGNASHMVQAYLSPKSISSNNDVETLTEGETGLPQLQLNTDVVSMHSIHTHDSDQSKEEGDVEYLQEAEAPAPSIAPSIVPSITPSNTTDLKLKITADNKGLRLSLNAVPASETVMVNALAKTDLDTPKEKPKEEGEPTVKKKNSIKLLQNRISSIFTNLPNDIELSDDSASDTETIREANHTSQLPSIESSAQHKPPPELAMYSESSVKSSPIKVSQLRAPTETNSYSTLKQIGSAKKKQPQLSSSLIDNARSIIHQNFTGSMSTASSIRETKRKKKKNKRTSENPLKNGGIPKKYWMNDAFVSECLNCFKTFSAFRRKHHCRFCGQIFCSQCTLFVSYQEHKEQSKTGVINPNTGRYKDKLRVCKPCYSDVIVYLSDSNSSSSDEDNDSDAISFETMDKFKVDDSSFQQSFARARSRSLSTNRREPLVGDSNKGFLKPVFSDKASITSKQPPSISVSTTKKRESVNIPASKSLYMSNLNPGSFPLNRASSVDPGSSWLKNYPHIRKPGNGSSMTRSNSLDNLSTLHSFKGSNKLSKVMSHNDSENGLRRIISSKYDQLGQDDKSDDDSIDEFESENEDEQVMSLYTSLNHHLAYPSNVTSTTMSPRAQISRPLASVSANAVPTLGEFPTMMVNERLYPKSISSGLRSSPGGSAFPRFMPVAEGGDLPPSSDNVFARNLLDDSPKSSLRSHERAHASLLRMRSRRRGKTVRNGNANRLPPLEVSDLKDNTPPLSTPTSPTPGTLPLSGYFRDQQLSPHVLSNDTFMPDILDFEVKGKISFGSLSDGSKVFDLPEKKDHHDSLGIFDEYSRKLDHKYLDLFRKILHQCLEDCDIKDKNKKWSTSLTRAISFVNSLKLSDTLDIKQYIKIKKIPGGRIEDTGIVDGIIMTKNIDSKKMAKSVDNPKIALLMFPIEYLKQKEQFISLRIVQSQQNVYINNLVSRLVSMGPDIVVVGDTVCQLANDFLEEANITVISNTKPQVIERISRYTKADIFQTVNDLFFKKGNLGTCKKFEVKKYVHDNIVKTFLSFNGTDNELGFTIALRGGDEETLNSIKYVTENLLATQINSKFERSMFDGHLLAYLEDQPEDSVVAVSKRIRSIKEEIEQQSVATTEVLLPDAKEVYEYIDLFMLRIISTSPAVKFSLPAPLYNAIEAFIGYYTFYQKTMTLRSCENVDDIDNTLIEDLRLETDIEKLPNKALDVLLFLKYANEIKLKSLLNQFQSRARTWSNYIKLPACQLYPIFHKSIHLLYSNVSAKYNTPCMGPKVTMVQYYTDNDTFIGLQLDSLFSECMNECDECGELMINHYRNYVHGNGRIDMSIEKYDDFPHEDVSLINQRTIWSVCKQCQYKTRVVAMADDTYFYSIGKYFEVAFWGKNVSLNETCECPHDFFKDHIRYYGFNNMVVKVEYSGIDTYEVIAPKKLTEYDTIVEINLKIKTLEAIQTKGSKFFNSISKRLNRVKVDTFDKAEDGAKRVEELKEKLMKQETEVMDQLVEIYNNTTPSTYLPLNSILRKLQELGVSWDFDFNEFENNYLPSENEITRITQFHLKNFLIDRYNDNPKQEDTKEADSETEDKEPADEKSNAEKDNTGETSQISESTEDLVGHFNDEQGKEISKLIPKALYNPNSNVGNKVNKMENLIEGERKDAVSSRVSSGASLPIADVVSPIKKPQRLALNHKVSDISLRSTHSLLSVVHTAPRSQNKVTQLASFFDQMNFDQISLEFKKHREQEMRKNLNKFRALPIVASKPIVEMYNKIEDVVDSNELDIEKRDKGRLPKRVTTDSLTSHSSQIKTPDKPLKEDDTSQIDEDSAKDKEKREKEKKDKLLDIPQPEKVSLLKSLTNFWADRSASLWDPLDYPLDSTEHTFADSDIIVREDEPSSLVAFCLSTNDYKQKIKSLAKEVKDTQLDTNEVSHKKIASFAKIEKKFKTKADKGKKPGELEALMTKNKSTHLKYQFVDGNTTLSCKIFYSEQFDALRKSCGKEEKFIQSLSRCIKWDSSGGKSGSSFLKTLDNRYIVKELSKSELESFVSMAPFYFKYISQSMYNTLTTALAKIFGSFQIQIKNNITGKNFKMDFLIMENLFYNLKTTRIFDLKGSMRNRHVTQTGRENEVLLDENMVEYIYESPLFVKEHLKKLLRGSLFNDTSFLSAMDVMDYSLIIGIDDQTKKLHIGIVDWLRTFTWDKKVENWVKGNNLIGGNRKGKDPTIVTPKQYRIRFREAMERYILEVPDIWYEGKQPQSLRNLLGT